MQHSWCPLAARRITKGRAFEDAKSGTGRKMKRGTEESDGRSVPGHGNPDLTTDLLYRKQTQFTISLPMLVPIWQVRPKLTPRNRPQGPFIPKRGS